MSESVLSYRAVSDRDRELVAKQAGRMLDACRHVIVGTRSGLAGQAPLGPTGLWPRLIALPAGCTHKIEATSQAPTRRAQVENVPGRPWPS